MDKVSVIIPLYNCAQFVTEAVESVLSQTYKDIEIIVIDDGSTDNAKEVLATYIEQKKIRYIYQNNRGLSAARNTGIKAAQGKYIKFLDSDDFLYPRQIDMQVEDIKNDHGFLSVTDHYVLRPNGEMKRSHIYIEKEGRQFASFIRDNRGVVHSFLTPKSLIEKAGGFDETLTACEDWDLWLRLLKDGAIIKHIPEPGCCYRISTTSMSTDVKKMFLQHCKVKEKVNHMLLKENNLSSFTKDIVLESNVRLIEEGIARRINLKTILPNTFGLTDKLFYNRKKGILRILYRILGVKRYTRLRYLVKKICLSGHEYMLLNESNLYRYGNQFQNRKDIPYLTPIKDAFSYLNHKGIILMYHRVTNLESDPWQLNVMPDYFRDHMRIIRKHARPVPISRIVGNLRRFSMGKKEIAVTFDDGYSDNFHYAKPILEQNEIPATFFIVSDAIDSRQEFWWDELERIILSSFKLPSLFQMTIAGKEYEWRVDSGRTHVFFKESPPNGIVISPTELYFALWHAISRVSFQEKWNYLQRINIWANHGLSTREGHLPMNSMELSALAQSPLFEIGAHTRRHPILSEISQENQLEEIIGSKRDLEKKLNNPVKTFAYPHGRFSDSTVRLLGEHGFDCACTTHPSSLRSNSDVYKLPRFTVLNWNAYEFENRLLSWLK